MYAMSPLQSWATLLLLFILIGLVIYIGVELSARYREMNDESLPALTPANQEQPHP